MSTTWLHLQSFLLLYAAREVLQVIVLNQCQVVTYSSDSGQSCWKGWHVSAKLGSSAKYCLSTVQCNLITISDNPFPVLFLAFSQTVLHPACLILVLSSIECVKEPGRAWEDGSSASLPGNNTVKKKQRSLHYFKTSIKVAGKSLNLSWWKFKPKFSNQKSKYTNVFYSHSLWIWYFTVAVIYNGFPLPVGTHIQYQIHTKIHFWLLKKAGG